MSPGEVYEKTDASERGYSRFRNDCEILLLDVPSFHTINLLSHLANWLLLSGPNSYLAPVSGFGLMGCDPELAGALGLYRSP